MENVKLTSDSLTTSYFSLKTTKCFLIDAFCVVYTLTYN